MPSLRKLRLISYTRSAHPPPTASGRAQAQFASTDQCPACCDELRTAVPQRRPESRASSAFPLLYIRDRRTIAATLHWRSNPHNVAGTATRRRSNHATSPVKAGAPSIEMLIPQPTAIARPFSCGTNDRARQSGRPNPTNETVRILVHPQHPCERKSAGALLLPARGQIQLCPSGGRKRCALRSSHRPCWPPVPRPWFAHTSRLIRLAWPTIETHVERRDVLPGRFSPACAVFAQTDPWARIAIPASSILWK